jgi:hypothetical protein
MPEVGNLKNTAIRTSDHAVKFWSLVWGILGNLISFEFASNLTIKYLKIQNFVLIQHVML